MIPVKLVDLIRLQAAQPPSGTVRALAERIRAIYGDAVQGILFYGSCLRSGDDRGGMVDLYVIVDRYRNAYRSRRWAALNQVLPPNVFYLETCVDERVVRAKYAVLSLADLKRGTSPAWFHSYLWGRFAQPAAILYAQSPDIAVQLHQALGQAVLTFLARVLPCAPERFSVRQLWLRGLSLSYRAELRAERPEKVAGLIQSAADYYELITAAALPLLPFRVERFEGREVTQPWSSGPPRVRRSVVSEGRRRVARGCPVRARCRRHRQTGVE